MKPDYADKNQMRALNANNIPKPTAKDGPILNNLAKQIGQPPQAGPQAGAAVRRPMPGQPPGGTPQVAMDQRIGPARPTPQLAPPGPQPGQQAQGGPQSIQAIIELLRRAGGGGQPGRRALPGGGAPQMASAAPGPPRMPMMGPQRRPLPGLG